MKFSPVCGTLLRSLMADQRFDQDPGGCSYAIPGFLTSVRSKLMSLLWSITSQPTIASQFSADRRLVNMGWIAYSFKGSVFIKKAPYKAQEYYLDRGASSQIYCNPTVIELETLGPVVNLKPGEKVIHVENWEVFSEGNWPGDVLDIFNSFSKP
jgi:hypothetical protein